MGVKLHLGCGKRFIPGFIHVDIMNYEHVDFCQSIATLPQFEDGSVDLIYCSHALCYFELCDLKQVLNEWRRVLNTEGLLRLAVPDVEKLVELYKNTKNISILYGPLLGKIPAPNGLYYYHKSMFDFKSLSSLLVQNGFTEPKSFDWRKTEHAAVDDYSQAYYPHMEKEDGVLVSLNVESRKKT